MNRARPLRSLLICALALASSAGFLVSTCEAQIPDTFTNLKVLPKEISKQDLISTMRAFSNALGEHCDYCHVHKDANPQNDMDWAADDLKAKTTARVMMQMTHTINATEIPKITTAHLDRVEVRCRTCHHGQARPMLIEDLLSGAYQAAGIDSLETKYEELRKEYYGSDTFNFGERMLPSLGEKLAGPGKPAEVVKFAEYNLHWFPQSGLAHLMLGQAHAAAGEKDAAMEELKKAVELDPGLEENAQRIISRLQPK
jgi:tetratricopeptide (TPR) repeat protein